MGKLDGKIAVVTGGSRGIGKDLCMGLSHEGAAVVVVSRTQKEGESRLPGSNETTARLIQEAGGIALPLTCNVTDEAEVAGLVQQVLDTYGRIDILVNNAGVLLPGTVEQMAIRHWDLAFRVNLRAPFLMCKAVLPLMVQQRAGAIVNITSRGAVGPGEGPYLQPGTGGTAYGAMKKGLERFTQGLAAEVAHYGISVNCLAPSISIPTEGSDFFYGPDTNYRGWRQNAAIMADALVLLLTRDPTLYTGRIRYDYQLFIEAGWTEAQVLAKYPLRE